MTTPIEALAQDIAEFYRGEHRPMNRNELVALMVAQTQHNKLWPEASYEQWDAAIDEAVEMRLLTLVGGTVWPYKPPKSDEPKTQLELF